MPTPDAVFLPAPDPGYRLTDAERARIPAALNADSLEALLSRIRPEYRAELLNGFEELSHAGKIAVGPGTTSATDPHLRALLNNIAAIHPSSPERKSDEP